MATSIANAQKTSSLSGKIIAADTKQPISFAVVYFANTALGAYTKEDGSFLIENIPDGKFTFTISMLGYKIYSQSMTFTGTPIALDVIALEPEPIRLKEVVVKAKSPKYYQYFKEFKHHFIGQTPNSFHCTINNMEDLLISFDKQNEKLIAEAFEPIEIINMALGYKIIYKLQTFEVDHKIGVYKVVGIPRFENLVPDNKREERRWTRARDRAYYGSMNHFMRSLKKRKLKENHFTISALTNVDEKHLTTDSLFVKGSQSDIHYKGMVKVIFDAELEEIQYSGPVRYQRPQTSYLKFRGDKVIVYDNGYYEDIFSIELDGYLGWSDRIADMVPLEYQPTYKLK